MQDKTFTQKIHKDTHMKTHAREKSYSCDICNKSLSQLGNRDSHMSTITGYEPYSYAYFYIFFQITIQRCKLQKLQKITLWS